MKKVDPITLEVMRNGFQSVAEEMGAALIRTALSPNIKDRRDCSTTIYTPEGDLVAQAEHVPLHIGLMVSVVKKVLEYYPIEKLTQGDIVVTNDPYVSGSHLPDIVMVAPVFIKGRCIGLLANLAHHVDVGGIAPGSMPTNVSEIFQEGIRIPPTLIRKGGEVDSEIIRFITYNVRTPYESIGDFQAQFAAINVGDRRLQEIVSKYGIETTEFYMTAIIDYAERRARAAISKLPEGVFEFEDFLEGDGLEIKRFGIRVKITCKDSNLHIDFTGTDSQANGSINSTRAVTLACVYWTVKTVIDPDLPSSAGAYKPITVITPKGTLVNPNFPAPVSNANINTAQRITDVLLGAFAQAAPRSVSAAGTGSMSIFTIGGADPETRQYYSYVETYGGGQGAMWDLDGMDGIHVNMTNTKNTPVEVIENTYPLRVVKYGLLPNTEGPGKFRGGVGMTRQITILDYKATVSLGTERRELPPWGLMGGGDAGTSLSGVITPDGIRELLPSKITQVFTPGNTIVLETAGGGGYGDPFTRDPKLVAEDVSNGVISADRAKEKYGVIINKETGKVDKTATVKLRSP